MQIVGHDARHGNEVDRARHLPEPDPEPRSRQEPSGSHFSAHYHERAQMKTLTSQDLGSNMRFLRVIKTPVGDPPTWDALSVDCPRRGRVGLEVCVECPL